VYGKYWYCIVNVLVCLLTGSSSTLSGGAVGPSSEVHLPGFSQQRATSRRPRVKKKKADLSRPTEDVHMYSLGTMPHNTEQTVHCQQLNAASRLSKHQLSSPRTKPPRGF